MTLEHLHPALNAALNATCFVFLVLGRMAIARGDEALHRKRMLTAFAASSVFLVSYLDGSGYSLSVAMNFKERRLQGFAATNTQWYPVQGRFEELSKK